MNDKTFVIYGKLTESVVTFVGCARGQAPPGSVVLQTVTSHPEICWVKWSLRFRRTLKDPSKALANPLAAFFTNASRLKRLLGDEKAERLQRTTNAEFLDYHERNPQVLAEMLADAQGEKAAGRAVYSAGEHLGQVRWGGTSTDRGENFRFKINSVWGAWYSRAMQMEDPNLIGFFRMRESLADGLIWVDGRKWSDFAAEHRESLKWSEPFEDLSSEDWEFHE
jgi:hypothetical protein